MTPHAHVGHSAGNGLLASNAWVEVSELEGLLSTAGRPCFVSFESTRPQAIANAQVRRACVHVNITVRVENERSIYSFSAIYLQY